MLDRLKRLVFAVLVAAAASVSAQGADSVPRNPFILLPNVRLWGADMTVGYRGLRLIPGVDTVFWAHLGGGWEAHALYRDFTSSGIVGTPTAANDPRAPYNRLTFDWQVGLSQGIVFSDRLDRSLLEGVLLAKWRLDRHYQNANGTSALLLDSALADRDGIFDTSFLIALRVDGVDVPPKRQTHDGVYAEASAEWSPEGLFGSPASFVRLNGHLEGYVTLAQAAHLALVAGDRLEGDLLLSPVGDVSTIPVWARASLGGMNPDTYRPEAALGGAVRGVELERFDGTLKLVNNLELRLLFPEILPVAIFPGVIAHVDAGLVDYENLDRVVRLPEDLLVSVGVGAFLRGLVADLVAYASYCLAPQNAAGFKVSFWLRTQF
jgi:hypothetical protein